MSWTRTKPVTDTPKTAAPLIHLYPRDPRYRLSGMTPPQPGDVARCGFVKKMPPKPEHDQWPLSCVVCAALARKGAQT